MVLNKQKITDLCNQVAREWSADMDFWVDHVEITEKKEVFVTFDGDSGEVEIELDSQKPITTASIDRELSDHFDGEAMDMAADRAERRFTTPY